MQTGGRGIKEWMGVGVDDSIAANSKRTLSSCELFKFVGNYNYNINYIF